MVGYSQINCSANASSGSAYPVFISQGLDIETPDCEHTTFGPHITQVFDDILQKNVFEFHSHIDADNDRCQVQDRVRMEIKGGPGTLPESQQVLGENSYYRWKFQIAENYTSGSSFHHIFQLKAKDGDDDAFPVLTLTLRTDELELSHNGGDSGEDLGDLAFVDLNLLRGRWIEAYLALSHQETGSIEITLKDLLSENILLDYVNMSVDLWRTGATYNRPKWGMYRSKDNSLADEVFRFADFCISETAADLCPADDSEFVDIVAPTIPINLMASDVMINSLNLTWDPSYDVFGVTAYQVYQDGTQIWEGLSTSLLVENLLGSTEYAFTLRAEDAAGNQSELSTPLVVTTDNANALPTIASNPFPADGAELTLSNLTLTWTEGENSDSTFLYFGTSAEPLLLDYVEGNSYSIVLDPSTIYYWQIIHKNINGETPSPVWTFSTTSGNQDAPWLVYRGNQRLDLETDFFTILNIPEIPTLDETSLDPNGSTNNFYHYQHEGAEKFRWRHEMASTDTAITVVARIKALNEDVNCICYFEMKSFGWREKLRVNQSTVKLERSDPVIEEDIPFEFKDDFHLMRVTMIGNVMKVYLDENPVPIAIGNSVDDDASRLFEWGKSGSPDCGASVDWIAILPNEANAPSQGAALPDDLFLSSIATLSSLKIDGQDVADFFPNILDYTFEVTGDEIPSLTWTTTSDLATAVDNNPSTVPNTQATIDVTAQDGFTNLTYTINYILSTSLENEILENEIKLFPNPTPDRLQVILRGNDEGIATIYNAFGQSIKQDIFISKEKQINVEGFSAGVYFMKIKLKNRGTVTKRFLIPE